MPIDSFTAGAVAGTVAAIITLPLERIKTIYQSSMKGAAVRSVRATVSHILATEGASGLVRGLVPTIAGVAPARAVYFGTYANVKSALTSSADDAPGPASHLISAATAGFTTATVIAPVFMVKTRMQLLGGLTGAVPSSTPSTTPHRLLDTVRGIYREGGLRAFYRGVSASYLGVSETVIQFVVYEQIKRWQAARAADEAAANSGWQAPQGKDGSKTRVSLLDAFTAGACAKLVASCASYPHEVVRTRLREHHDSAAANARGMVGWLRHIARTEGVAGLYGGLGIHLIRTVPNAAMLFVVMEALAGV